MSRPDFKGNEASVQKLIVLLALLLSVGNAGLFLTGCDNDGGDGDGDADADADTGDGGDGDADADADTGADATVYIVVDGWSASAFGEYTMDATITEYTCNDGSVDGGETCDDENTTDGDGCSSICATEDGYVCEGAPSVCRALVCGDSIIEGSE